MNAQQIFKRTFKALINEDCFISPDIDRCQGVLEHVLSQVDFSVGTDIYIHCVISVRIRSYFCPYFPAFGLITERYAVSLWHRKDGKM